MRTVALLSYGIALLGEMSCEQPHCSKLASFLDQILRSFDKKPVMKGTTKCVPGLFSTHGKVGGFVYLCERR